MHRLLIKILAGRANVGLKNLADPEIPDLQCAACMGCRLLSAGANYAEQNLDTDNSGPDTANVPGGADTCLGGADLAPQNLGCILPAAAHISSDQVFKQQDPVSRDEEPIPPLLVI